MRLDLSENQKTSLGTLCLDLYEDIESHYHKSAICVQGKPSGNSFEEDIQITDAVYCALYGAICALIDQFHTGNSEVTIAAFQTGLEIVGLNISDQDLAEICSMTSDRILIQKDQLGLALAFLEIKHIKIEQLCGKNNKKGITVRFRS